MDTQGKRTQKKRNAGSEYSPVVLFNGLTCSKKIYKINIIIINNN